MRGDTQTISKSILGSAMLGAAWEMRNSEHAGERWYEARWGDKTIDLRPFGPFSGYLFIADIVKRYREGTLNTLRGKDIAAGVLGANVRAGTGLYLVDTLIEGLSGLRDPDTFVEKASQFAGEFAGGFFTPLQQLNDIFAQYDESQREIKETRSGDPVKDLLAPSLARIPGLASSLPAAEIPTREAPLEKPAPALKQLGISLRAAKNSAEAELDRLGFTRQEIVPSTGNTKANNLIAKHMGPLVENFLGRVVQNEGYRQMTEAQKGAYVQNILKRLRGLARRRAIAENPKLFRKLKRTSRRQQRARDELKET